jgi:hypothetical protein
VELVVGFSTNFFNVVRDDKRLLLHNGYHRACTLRTLGITHAPCVIQTVTRRDELDLIAKDNVAEDPTFYFAARHSPLLKDFFGLRIRRLRRGPQDVRRDIQVPLAPSGSRRVIPFAATVLRSAFPGSSDDKNDRGKSRGAELRDAGVTKEYTAAEERGLMPGGEGRKRLA